MSTAVAPETAASDCSDEYKALQDDVEVGGGAPQMQAAVMPDGQVVMLSPENPYRAALPVESPRPEGPTEAEVQAVFQNVWRPALQLEQMARLVRLLAMLDMAFSLMHAVAEMWPAAIAAVMSYCGYVGARTFRRDLSRIYLCYLCLFAFARVALSAHFLLAPLPPHAPPTLPLYMSLTAVVQLVIAHFVWRFYNLLPRSLEDARLVQHIAETHSAHVIAV